MFATVLMALTDCCSSSAAASVKRAVMNMVVHAYDLFFYLSSWSTVSYLWSDQRRYVLGLVAAPAGCRLRRLARLPRRQHARSAPLGGAGPLSVAALAWYGAAPRASAAHMQFYYENLYVSSFYASWGETLEALWRGALLEAAPRAAAAGAGFLLPASCDPRAKPPHIILIHQESVVQPSLFPTLRYDTLGRSVLPLPGRAACTGCASRPTAAPPG